MATTTAAELKVTGNCALSAAEPESGLGGGALADLQQMHR